MGPIGLLSEYWQQYHDYKIVKEEKFKGEKVIVIEAVPKYGYKLNQLFGKIWVRKSDFSILKIEWNQEAIENYKHALELNPNCDSAWYNLGLVFSDYELAEKIGCYKRAIDINPHHAKAFANLGIAFSKLGLEDAAFICFKRAIKLDKKLKGKLNTRHQEYA